MMLRVTDQSVITNSRTGFSINFLFYLSVEFLIGVVISCTLAILDAIKSLLPKPPRDLSGDVVLVRTLLFIYFKLYNNYIFIINVNNLNIKLIKKM